jgi:hypothetical protein
MSSIEAGPSNPNIPSEGLSNNPERHCIFISGAGGYHDGLKGIREGLEKPYGGSENVTVFNSIYSPDQPNPRRFEQIADSIKHHLSKGQLDIVVHSLGAAELYRALKELKERDKNYFEDNERNKKLHIILVGPSGSSGNFIEKAAYLKNVMRMARMELPNSPLPTNSNTLERGVASLSQFPSNIENIAQKTRDALPSSWSNRRDGIKNISFKPIDNKEYLSSEQRARLVKLDAEFNAATSKKDISKFLKQRGEIVKSSIDNLLSARKPEDTPPAEPLEPHTNTKGLLKTIFIGLGNRPIKKFRRLAQNGVEVSWLVPEFDYVVPVKKALRFYDKLEGYKAADHVQVKELWTHTSPAVQPKTFGEDVFSLNKNIPADRNIVAVPTEIFSS